MGMAVSTRRFLLAAILARTTPTQDSQWASRELRDGHKSQVEGVAFSGDGRWLASADNSGTLVIRSIPTLDVAATLQGQNFTEVAWSPDGSSLIAGGFDSLVYIWHKPFMLPARTLRYPGQVEAIAITSDGVVLAAGGGDRIIRRWALASGQELNALRGHTDDIYAVRVSPNGHLIASAGRDRTIRVWNAPRLCR